MSGVLDPKDRGNESDTGVSTSQEEGVGVGITDAGKVEIGNDKPVFKPTREFFLAFIALCTVALAIAFDATSLSVALPTISSAIGGTALQAFWSGTSFLLASTVLQPTVASLSNIFGRKYVSSCLENDACNCQPAR